MNNKEIDILRSIKKDFIYLYACSIPPVVAVRILSIDAVGVVLKLNEVTTVVVLINTDTASALVVISIRVSCLSARSIGTWRQSFHTRVRTSDDLNFIVNIEVSVGTENLKTDSGVCIIKIVLSHVQATRVSS